MNDRAFSLGLGALALVGLCGANPDRPLPFQVCAFKYLTGWNCPLCGLTRSVCHALRGHWAQSWHYHPAGILVAAGLVGWMLRSTMKVLPDAISTR